MSYLDELIYTPGVVEVRLSHYRGNCGDTRAVAVVKRRGVIKYAGGFGLGAEHAADCCLDGVKSLKWKKENIRCQKTIG